jgi:hypothetical protein
MANVPRRSNPSAGCAGLIVVLGALLACMPRGIAADAGPVTNVRVTEWSKTAAILTFDVGWKNSWRHEGNHDALWVFFKYRPEGSDEWRHLRLAADKTVNPTGYGQAGGSRVDLIVPDGDDGFLGMLVRRADYGLGPIAATGVTARWDLAAAPGISPDQKISFLAVGIEMAYVPEGAFVLGGGSEPLHFYEYTDGSQHQKPYRVAAAGAIPTGRQQGRLWARRGNEPEDGGETPAGYPTGFGGFYAMKYHAMFYFPRFVESLPPDEVEALGAAAEKMNKHGGMSWADGAAFAAWAAIRPLTELEYEKLTRGPIEPDWDTGDTLNHPSFWGVESINGWRSPREQTVTVANAAGRRFRGTHGRGTPALPADWPQGDAAGSGIRGGHGRAGNPSYRLDAADGSVTRAPGVGWRGARTAPRGVGL